MNNAIDNYNTLFYYKLQYYYVLNFSINYANVEIN